MSTHKLSTDVKSLEKFKGRVFMRPVFGIKASRQLLTARHIKFERDEDDLNTFKIARFSVGPVQAMLFAYAHYATNEHYVWVDFEGSTLSNIREVDTAHKLLEALNLSAVEITWTNPVFK